MRRFGHIEARLTLPLRYFGTVDYYAAMGACAIVTVDDTARYDKRQKGTHRMDIVDTHGLKSLTVPVSRPDNVVGPLRWSDIAVSRHGQWWHVVSETLTSAYGRTPFFEFYIDRLRPFFSSSTPDICPDVATLCRESDAAVRAILGLDNDITYASQSPGCPQSATQPDNSSRSLTQPANPSQSSTHLTNSPLSSTLSVITQSDLHTNPIEYYQVRHDKFGFLPHLSILDLIFNMGPESPLILREMV